MMIMTHDSQITLGKKKLKNVYILIKMAFFGFAITRQQDRYEYGFNQPTLNTREQDKWPYEHIDKRKRTIPCFKQVLLLISPTSFTVSLHESPHHWFNVTCKRNQPQSHMYCQKHQSKYLLWKIVGQKSQGYATLQATAVADGVGILLDEQ